MQLNPITVDLTYPIWTFQVDIPDELSNSLTDANNWHEKNSFYRFPINEDAPGAKLMYSLTPGIQHDIMAGIFDPQGVFAQQVKSRWYGGVNFAPTAMIIKDASIDQPMVKHIDHRNVFAASILNLADNPCSTKFFMNGELIYTAPTQKGHGVVFLNTEYSEHGFGNNTGQDRYICFMNMMLDMGTVAYKFT